MSIELTDLRVLVLAKVPIPARTASRRKLTVAIVNDCANGAPFPKRVLLEPKHAVGISVSTEPRLESGQEVCQTRLASLHRTWQRCQGSDSDGAR